MDGSKGNRGNYSKVRKFPYDGFELNNNITQGIGIRIEMGIENLNWIEKQKTHDFESNTNTNRVIHRIEMGNTKVIYSQRTDGRAKETTDGPGGQKTQGVKMGNPNSNRATTIYYSQHINGAKVTTNRLELAKPMPTHFRGQIDRFLNLEEGGDASVLLSL